jgi:hypothetical protein
MIDLPARLKGVRRSGRDRWAARCPAHDDRSPSLSVAHSEGKWLLHCFAGCSIDAITTALGLKVSDLFDDAYSRRRPLADAYLVDPVADAMRREEERAEIARRIDGAGRIWRKSRRHGIGRLDAYLASRCLTRPQTGHMRFHAGVWHKESGRKWPAMVCLITDGVTGEARGVHATFLDDVGVGKAPIDPDKKTFGIVRGGVIRLTPRPPPGSGEPLVIAEGIETALTALAAGSYFVWAAITCGNMKVIDLPTDIRSVVIVADMDDGGIGLADARVLAERLSRQGRRIRIARPPQGSDLNDLLRAGKDDEESAA